MGYHIHHTIICTSWNEEHLLVAHKKALEIFPFGVSGITKGESNGYDSFFIAPDGSKEGWSISDEYNARRAAFGVFLRTTNNFVDWAEFSFGGDEPIKNTDVVDYGFYEEKEET